MMINMNTIFLIILTIIFLVFAILGILIFKDVGFLRGYISITLFMIGITGIIFLGSSMISDDIYIKEIICSYTVGKSDETCMDVYNINLNYSFPSISDKVGLSYLIFDAGLCIIMCRKFLIMMWHFDPHD